MLLLFAFYHNILASPCAKKAQNKSVDYPVIAEDFYFNFYGL